MGLAVFASIAISFLMVAGTILAWRKSRQDQAPAAAASTWRDDSLDEWRRQRDAEIEAERTTRKASAPTHEGSSHEREGDARPHQRMGG